MNDFLSEYKSINIYNLYRERTLGTLRVIRFGENVKTEMVRSCEERRKCDPKQSAGFSNLNTC